MRRVASTGPACSWNVTSSIAKTRVTSWVRGDQRLALRCSQPQSDGSPDTVCDAVLARIKRK
jgi:hypothetical protein